METAARLNDSGIALTEANRPYEAIPLFREALIMEPENPLLWLNLGIAQQKIGEYEEALDCFQRAVYIDDDLAECWGAMALIYFLWQTIWKKSTIKAILLRRSANGNGRTP